MAAKEVRFADDARVKMLGRRKRPSQRSKSNLRA